jgi:hypothetical protein
MPKAYSLDLRERVVRFVEAVMRLQCILACRFLSLSG